MKKQPFIRFALFWLVISVAALILCACGEVATSASYAGSTSADSSSSSSSGASAKSNLSSAAAASATTSSSSSNGGGSASDSATPNPVVVDERKILRNGNISILADKVQETLAKLTALAHTEGGLVFSTNTTHAGDNESANITLQVPPAKFDETMTGIRNLAVKVTAENSSSQDVTEEYVDNEAAIKNLSQTEQQLNLLLSKAATIGEVLTVQKEITSVRGEIDKLQGRQNYIGRKTALGTIVVNILPATTTPVVTPTPEKPVQSWDFGRSFQQAWENSLNLLQGLVNVLIFLVVYMWLLPFILLGIWLSLKLYRRMSFNIKPPVALVDIPWPSPPPPTESESSK